MLNVKELFVVKKPPFNFIISLQNIA